MSDMGEMYGAMREGLKDRKRIYGIPCPECQRLLPRAQPKILLPGMRCRMHNFTDTRPESLMDEWYAERQPKEQTP